MQIIKRIRNHKKISASILLLVDLIFFTVSNPAKMPVYLMVLAFLLILLSVYAAMCFIYKTLYSLGYIQGRRRWLREGISAFIFLLVLMQSVGQLSSMDVMSMIPIAAVAYFYYSYIGTHKQSD